MERLRAKTSPFIYHANMNLNLQNDKVSCDHKEIERLRSKSILSMLDFEVMRILYNYQVLNRYNLEYILKTEISKNQGKISIPSDLKRTLAKLTRLGLVCRYQFTWENDVSAGKSPCCYTVSRGVFYYFKKRSIEHSKQFFLPTEVELLNHLVLNQFYIRFCDDYGSRILSKFYWKKVKVQSYEYIIPCSFRLKHDAMPNKSLDVVLLPIRRNQDWEREMDIKLSSIQAYSERHPKLLYQPLYIIICEDDLQMKEAYMSKEHNSSISELLSFYTSDIAAMDGNLLEHLYSYHLEKNQTITVSSNSIS